MKLVGGLGNQLFQYAVARAVAQRNNVPLKLDLSSLEGDPLRKYGLHHFNINASIASRAEVGRLSKVARKGVRKRIHKLIHGSSPYYRRSVLRERSPRFDPNITKATGEVYLVGYWQSEKYFKDIEQLLRTELTLRHTKSPANRKMSHVINQTESVSVHVRQGDYISNPVANQVHGTCSLEYYQAAIERIAETVKRPHFFVFSDDSEWAKENLRFKYPVVHVTHNGEENDYEDLRLMSHCKYHIIANSSFSWWGAWLSNFPGKIVIAPQKWFVDASRDTGDLLPASWIQL